MNRSGVEFNAQVSCTTAAAGSNSQSRPSHPVALLQCDCTPSSCKPAPKTSPLNSHVKPASHVRRPDKRQGEGVQQQCPAAGRCKAAGCCTEGGGNAARCYRELVTACAACSRRASARMARLCSKVAWLCANCSTHEATKCAIMANTRLCQADAPPTTGTYPHTHARNAPRLLKLSASRAANHLRARTSLR